MHEKWILEIMRDSIACWAPVRLLLLFIIIIITTTITVDDEDDNYVITDMWKNTVIPNICIYIYLYLYLY